MMTMTPKSLIALTKVMHYYQFGVKEGLILGLLASCKICTRSKDIAEMTDYPVANIRGTLQILKNKGFVEVATNYWGASGYVLTKAGWEIFKHTEL